MDYDREVAIKHFFYYSFSANLFHLHIVHGFQHPSFASRLKHLFLRCCLSRILPRCCLSIYAAVQELFSFVLAFLSCLISLMALRLMNLAINSNFRQIGGRLPANCCLHCYRLAISYEA